MDEAEKKILADKLLAIAKSEIRISYKNPSHTPSGTGSRIGGKPAVPDGFVWPVYTAKAYGDDEEKTRPLSFLAQIDLKDVSEHDKEGLLPKSGILSFFYELETMTWGYDPKDKGSARVYYFPDTAVLHTEEFPEGLEDYAVLPELALDMEQHISIPEFGDFDDDTDYDWDDYRECCEDCGYDYDEWGDRTKMLGYPDVIQNPMEEECETVTRGYRQGSREDFEAVSDEEKADIKAKSGDWMLLFQMGTVTDDDYELMFGDCGHIYFWIRKQDLAQLCFDNIWLVLQCG